MLAVFCVAATLAADLADAGDEGDDVEDWVSLMPVGFNTTGLGEVGSAGGGDGFGVGFKTIRFISLWGVAGSVGEALG